MENQADDVTATETDGKKYFKESIDSATKAGEAETEEIDFDDLMSRLGDIGSYQWIMFVLLSLGQLAEVMVVMAFVFVAATPGHTCATPELDHLGLDDAVRLNLTIPPDGEGSTSIGQVTYSSCQMYDRSYVNWTVDDVYRFIESSSANGDNSSIVKCRSGWTYDKSVYTSTITTDWDLVCDNSWMASFAYTALGLGQLVGAIFFGYITDRFGRKRPYFFAVTMVAALGVGLSFSPNFIVYCALQFAIGANTVAMFATVVTLVVEMVGVSWRGHFGTAGNYFWTSGYMLLAGIAYALRDWSNLQLVVACITAALLPTAFVVPESPRWLYIQRKTKQADRIMHRLAACNRVQFPKHVTVYVKDDDLTSTATCFDLFGTAALRKTSAILFLNWFANALIYYGISLFIPMLAGDEYLNFFISGLVEIPGYLVAGVSIRYLGRRWPLCVTMAVGGVALLVTMAIPEDINWLTVTLAFVGKLCVTASWAIAIVFTAELYPTVIRGLGMFTCTLCGNIGNALAPLVGLLAQYSLYLPLVIFGVFSIAAGLSSLLLEETRGRHLADTIDRNESTSQQNFFRSPTADTSLSAAAAAATSSPPEVNNRNVVSVDADCIFSVHSTDNFDSNTKL